MSQQIQITGGAKVRNLQDVIIGTSGVLSSVAFDVANGVPRLDVNGKILVAQLPNSVMEYKGTWNAATNTPTLVNGTGNQGDVYLCNVAGTVDFGAGAIAFFVGDQVIYSGSIWQRASGATGTVTSVAITESGDSLNITGSPITTSGTINIGFNGTNLQYVNGAGNLTTFPILTGYVPYTGATANVDLGTFNLTADVITGATGSFTSNGGSDTFAINHSSGAGIALNITKGGSGEGLYINKTSGSGNAATIIGTLNATTLVKSGGTSSQYLMADGSVSTLTNPVTGTGTTNTLPKFTAASTIGNSNITDTGSLITLGSNTTISSGIFRVGSSSIIAFQLYASKNITGGTSAGEVLSDGVTQSDVTNRSQYFATAASTAAASFTLASLFHFRATQSTFGAGSTVTNQIGFEVDATLIGATNNFGFRGLIPAGTNRWNIYMDGTANNYLAGSLGIGTTILNNSSLNVSKTITGSTTSIGIIQGGVVQSGVTSSAYGFYNSATTQAAAFTLGTYIHYGTEQSTIGSGSAITTQIGYNASATLIGATNNYGFKGSIASGTNRWNLYMDGTANNYMAGSLGIGTTSLGGYTLRLSKSITGGTSLFAIRQDGTVQSDVTSDAVGFRNDLNTAAAAFALTNYFHYYAIQNTIGAGSSITNQYGYAVTSSMTGATNNYGFYGNIASGTNRWNLYMGGTANNYLAGSLGIGTTSLTGVTINAARAITGSTTSFGILQQGQVQSNVTSIVHAYCNYITTQGTAFTLGIYNHYSALAGSIGAGSTVTNQRGFFVESGLTGATNNFGFYGDIPAGTNRWNLYMSGTAANYMAGQLLIGTTTSTFLLDVNGTTRLQGITTISRNDSGSGSSLNIVNTSTTGANNIRIGQDLANNTLGFGYHPSGASTYNSLIPNTAYAFALSGASQLSFNTTTATQAITFSTNDWNEKMRIFGNGNVNIGGGNTPTDIASAKLAITSTTQGFLPPRGTNAQRNAIASPAVGLVFYCTDATEGLYIYTSSGWKSLTMV